jgi:hypothetical protein
MQQRDSLAEYEAALHQALLDTIDAPSTPPVVRAKRKKKKKC